MSTAPICIDKAKKNGLQHQADALTNTQYFEFMVKEKRFRQLFVFRYGLAKL